MLLMRQIEWSFHLPQASNMGGIWEQQIRTVCTVLCAIMGSQLLNNERLHTFLCEAGAMINSRPITLALEDPCDLEVLTPNHILRMVHTTAHLLGAQRPTSSSARGGNVQYLVDQFWKCWIKEYLPRLCLRSGPIKEGRSLKNGDLVIVTRAAVPRNQWKLDRIVHVHPGVDGIVQKVTVKMAQKVLVRTVTKLCFLEGLDRN